jgi:hypothetical protein
MAATIESAPAELWGHIFEDAADDVGVVFDAELIRNSQE